MTKNKETKKKGQQVLLYTTEWERLKAYVGSSANVALRLTLQDALASAVTHYLNKMDKKNGIT